jgi:hypothetical protein
MFLCASTSLPLFSWLGSPITPRALFQSQQCSPCKAVRTVFLKLNGAWQEEGLALFGLSASPDGLLYKDSIIRFWGPRPHGLPYHALSQGDIVLISQTKPGEHVCVMPYSVAWISRLLQLLVMSNAVSSS